MRIQPWMKAVACAAMLLATQTPCRGQTPFSDGSSVYGSAEPDFQGYLGTSSPAPASYYPPPYAAGGSADPNLIFPAGTPDNFQPWPEISPFNPANVAQTQTYNQDGLWFKQLLYRRRDYFASIGISAVQFRNAGNATIGSPYAHANNMGVVTGPGVPLYYAGVPNGTPPTTTGSSSSGSSSSGSSSGTSTTGTRGNFFMSSLIQPYPAIATTAGQYVANTDSNLYPIWSASALGHPSTVAGLQGEVGYFNEDETGIKLSGWGALTGNSEFQRGQSTYNGVPINQSIIDVIGGGFITPLNGNIPLYNGEPVPGQPNFGDGSTAKYDILYRLKMSTAAYGTNMSLYQQPIYKDKGIMLRPMWGARYLYINENFGFTGIDSGYTYTLTSAGTTSGSGTGTGTGSGSSSSSGSNSGVGVYATTTSLSRLYNMYTATLNNKVESNLAGPEIGLRFDLGSPRKGFNISGESILGLMVNYENIQMSGNQIGDALGDVRIRGYTTPRILDNDSSFSNSRSSTHLSPTFQQSIYADFDFIDVIPVLREMSILDNSSFRIGYTVLWVGALSRPADTIKWQGYPLYPQIQRNYNSWWAQQVTASLNFNF